MLRKALLLSLAALAACTSTPSDRAPRNDPTSRTIATVPIYFYDGRGLAQEYRELTGVQPVAEVVGHAIDGPASRDLGSAIPAGTRLVDAGEGEAGAIVELNARFWAAPDSRLRAAAAQIVFSLAALEEGRSVTLLDGLTPGRVPGVDQPLDRADLNRYRPWLLIRQPVAGTLVGRTMPAVVDARTGYPLRIWFEQGTERTSPATIEKPQTVRTPGSFSGPGSVVIEDSAGHRAAVPVRFS